MLDNIDFTEFYEILLDATRKIFRWIQESHPDETFYAFYLYHMMSGYVVPTCHSEEAHMRLGNLTNIDRAEQTLKWFGMRWEAGGWGYGELGDKHVAPVTDWIEHNLSPFRRTGAIDGVHTLIDDRVAGICLRVLKALDEEGFFGRGETRERAVLSVIHHNTHYENDLDRDYVYKLNPFSTYKRWCIEQEMHQLALMFFSVRIRRRYLEQRFK